jgi:hypothetical protein
LRQSYNHKARRLSFGPVPGERAELGTADLQTAAAPQPGDDAKIASLKAQAQKAIQDGELGRAKEILAKVEKIQDEALKRLALNTDPGLGHRHYPSRDGAYGRCAGAS